jgi:hypothetical protein
MLKSDSSDRPSQRSDGENRRIFTDEQGDALVERFWTTYLDQGVYYCEEHFHNGALTFYAAIRKPIEFEARMNPEAEHRLESLSLFRATAPFIRYFHLWNPFSLHRPSLNGRWAAASKAQEAFLRYVDELLWQ